MGFLETTSIKLFEEYPTATPIILIFGMVICVVIMTLLIKKLIDNFKDLKNIHRNNKALERLTASDFINVKDIQHKYLYTQDGNVMMYIKINPISIDLLSNQEKMLLTKRLTAEISTLQKEFKFISVSRPVDINNLLADFNTILSKTDNQMQKEILRNEMLAMKDYATSKDVVERQFFIMIWEKLSESGEKEILKRGRELVSKFSNCGITCDIADEKEIARLCNLINNPTNSCIQDCDLNASIPMLTTYKGGKSNEA